MPYTPCLGLESKGSKMLDRLISLHSDDDVLYASLAILTTLEAMELVVALRSCVFLWHGPRATSILQVQCPALHFHIALLAPILTP